MGITKAWTMAVLALALPFVAAGCSDSDSAPEVAAAPAIRAEEVVSMKDLAGFLCTTKDDFNEAVTHAVSGEKTMLAQMFDDSRCFKLDPGIPMRVLHVDYAVIELAPTAASADVSAWTAPEFVTHFTPKS